MADAMTSAQKATIYHASGKRTAATPGDGKKFSLEELQKAVGGYIEQVPGHRGAFCNEDGLRLNLPPNRAASDRFGIRLVGDVIEVSR
jgi:Domain of unknown function (DUF3846)